MECEFSDRRAHVMEYITCTTSITRYEISPTWKLVKHFLYYIYKLRHIKKGEIFHFVLPVYKLTTTLVLILLL